MGNACERAGVLSYTVDLGYSPYPISYIAAEMFGTSDVSVGNGL
jgi:hypothetical protein